MSPLKALQKFHFDEQQRFNSQLGTISSAVAQSTEHLALRIGEVVNILPYHSPSICIPNLTCSIIEGKGPVAESLRKHVYQTYALKDLKGTLTPEDTESYLQELAFIEDEANMDRKKQEVLVNGAFQLLSFLKGPLTFETSNKQNFSLHPSAGVIRLSLSSREELKRFRAIQKDGAFGYRHMLENETFTSRSVYSKEEVEEVIELASHLILLFTQDLKARLTNEKAFDLDPKLETPTDFLVQAASLLAAHEWKKALTTPTEQKEKRRIGACNIEHTTFVNQDTEQVLVTFNLLNSKTSSSIFSAWFTLDQANGSIQMNPNQSFQENESNLLGSGYFRLRSLYPSVNFYEIEIFQQDHLNRVSFVYEAHMKMIEAIKLLVATETLFSVLHHVRQNS